MVVDPSSGLPVENSDGPSSMAGTYGSTLGQSYGVQMPLYYDAMSAIPPATVTVAWNMGRVRSTIMNNRDSVSGAGGIRQTFSPFRFNSLANLENIDREAFKTSRKPRGLYGLRGQLQENGTRVRPGYSPFNVLSNLGNSAASSKLAGPNRVAKGTRVFAPGTFGTMSAMSSIAGGNLSPAKVDNVIGAIGRFQKASGVAGSTMPLSTLASKFSGPAQGQFLSSALGAARFSNIKYAGNVAGYYQGAQAARTGTLVAARTGASNVAGEAGYFGKGISRAAADYAGAGSRGGQTLARVAGSRGAALGFKAVPYVGQAMIVADITRFLGKSVGRGMKLGIEGVKSAQGDLIKNGPMGMGYKDNSVAATSRQRGVMAISNSRLNARSFLGQEGAYMHSVFG